MEGALHMALTAGTENVFGRTNILLLRATPGPCEGTCSVWRVSLLLGPLDRRRAELKEDLELRKEPQQ